MFKNVNLVKGPIIKSLLLFAIPLLISNVFQQLYNMIDIMVVGNYLGEQSLAAIGSSTAVFDLLIGFGLGVGGGFSIVCARYFGAKDEAQLRKSVAGSIILGVIISAAIMILSSIYLYPLLEMLQTPANIIDESYAYISIIGMSVGVIFLYNLCAGLLRAIGNSLMALVFLIISSVLNMVLDIVFITQFNMGIQGAAIATVIAQAVSGIFCLIYILCKVKVLIPHKEDFKVGKKLFADLASQGIAMGLMFAIVSIGTVILQFGINGFGHLVVAAHTSARKVMSLLTIPLSTLAVALSTFVSQNKGADQIGRIRKSVFYCNVMVIVWGVFVTLLMLVCSKYLIQLISGSTNAELIHNGSRYLILNTPFFGILGLVLNIRNSLQGIGKKVVPLISSIFECIAKILFVIYLIPSLGYFGVIISEPVIWCGMCLILVIAFYSNKDIRNAKRNEGLSNEEFIY